MNAIHSPTQVQQEVDFETTVPPDEGGETRAARFVFAVVRLSLAFVFLWAFFDKLFGWGKATPSDRAWINGGSPTTGYLRGVEGPFDGFFDALAGHTWADWLFMIGLLSIGIALALGIGLRISAATGALLLGFMWMASLPLENNPFMDDHLIYALVIIGLALIHSGDTLGLGCWWKRTALVRRFPALI